MMISEPGTWKILISVQWHTPEGVCGSVFLQPPESPQSRSKRGILPPLLLKKEDPVCNWNLPSCRKVLRRYLPLPASRVNLLKLLPFVCPLLLALRLELLLLSHHPAGFSYSASCFPALDPPQPALLESRVSLGHKPDHAQPKSHLPRQDIFVYAV